DHLVERDPDGEELVRMINAITTNKTDFFREAHHFEFIRSGILPGLVSEAGTGGDRRLRGWSAGCSSGEGPCRIALMGMGGLPRPWAWDVKILASDIDTDMLAKGREGVYSEDRLATLPPDLRERYFLRGRGSREGLVCVRPEVKELVAFRRINLRDESWPIRTRFDWIFCRNVIIYFDRTLQEGLVSRFVQLLKPGGYLFLGHSESLLGMRLGLKYVGNTVYQKANDDAPVGQGGHRGGADQSHDPHRAGVLDAGADHPQDHSGLVHRRLPHRFGRRGGGHEPLHAAGPRQRVGLGRRLPVRHPRHGPPDRRD